MYVEENICDRIALLGVGLGLWEKLVRGENLQYQVCFIR